MEVAPAVIAYKFLREGAVGPFSGVRWPAPAGGRPGAWLEAEGALETCVAGVHACPPGALAYWFDEELWRVELAGEVLDEGTVLVARRGRLLERVAGWPAVARDFAEDCRERALGRAAAGQLADPRVGELLGLV
ncbi:MAG TPA: hypothetical protein VNJ46_05135, partial [Gaiellaceae bacterium]|nr:hypothetical protein [Gaiellaceae bacterium]